MDGKMDKFNVIKKLVNKENPIVLEIGSHNGGDTQRFIDTFSDLELYGFEPNPYTFKVLTKYINSLKCKFFNIALSNQDKNDVTFYMALKEITPEYFDKNRNSILRDKYTQKFTKDDFFKYNMNRSGASSLKKGHEAVSNAKECKIEVKKLDTWTKENNIEDIDFIWMDVQGSEKDVIEGGKESLKKVRFIWIEYGEVEYDGGLTREQTIELLKKHNFTPMEKYSSVGSKGDLMFMRE